MNPILKSLSALLLLIAMPLYGGTVTGTMVTPNGTPLKNGTLSFSLAQAGLIIGSGAVVPVASACYTSTDGSVVGIANPLHAPHVSSSTSGGLPAGNYYAQLTAYATDGHETLASPEVVISLPTGGSFTLTYEDPIPLGYTQGVKAYVATSSGAETLQGTTTGGAIYTQTAPLVSGAAEPTSNSTICSIAFNDTIIPYSGYKVSLTSSAGNAYPGYPQLWQLNGGLSGTVNITNGTPLWDGHVIYPQAIVAQPLNHGPQSIAGPLGMSGYDIFGVGALGIGTNTPAYPLDVHGGVANADLGYLANGNGGTLHQCLTSDGTAFNTPATCLLVAAIFYQTVQQHGGVLTQRPVVNFVAPLQAADNSGSNRTDVSLATSGTGSLVPTETGTIGATTNCATWDGSGGITKSTAPCPATVPNVQGVVIAGCATAAGTYETCNIPTVTWPVAFTGAYAVSCSAIDANAGPGASGNESGIIYPYAITLSGFSVWVQNNRGSFAFTPSSIQCVGIQL